MPREEQYALFEAQLQLARELDLPVSVHDREAHAEMYDLLRKYKPRGALHCYSGSADDAAWLVEQGMYLGFGGAVTYKGAKRAAKVLAAIPHDRALLETDCPYMAPEPFRGKECHSGMIRFTAQKVADIKPRTPVCRSKAESSRLTILKTVRRELIFTMPAAGHSSFEDPRLFPFMAQKTHAEYQ